MSWSGLEAAGEGLAEGLGGSFAVTGDGGDEVAAFRFFNSAGVGAPRFNTGRLGSSSGSGDGVDMGEACAVLAVAAGPAVAAGRFRTGRSESSSASGAGDEDACELAAAGRFRTGRFESSLSAGADGGEDAAGAVPEAGFEGVGEAGPAAGLVLDDASSGALGLGPAR